MKVVQSGESMLVLEDSPWFNGFIFYGIGVACIVGLGASATIELTMRETLIGALAIGWPTLLGLLLLRHDRLIFDREKRQLTRERRSIRGKTTEIYDLDRVVGGRVEETPDGLDTLFQMEVQLENPSETLPFTNYRVFGNQPKLLAQIVNEWLANGNVDTR
ncbi:MAG: hypothetical protein V4753_15195 [Pseudomonadota bacterium]